MTKTTITYNPKEGDPHETDVGRVKFIAGTPVELTPNGEWLIEKLRHNPWFDVKGHADAPAAKPAAKTHRIASGIKAAAKTLKAVTPKKKSKKKKSKH